VKHLRFACAANGLGGDLQKFGLDPTPPPKIGGLRPAQRSWTYFAENPLTHTYQRTQQAMLSTRLERAALMEKKWRVGDLQPVQGTDLRAMSQTGFVLYDETGQPCVTFGYGTMMKQGWLGSMSWRH
jgi:hypothetical protein